MNEELLYTIALTRALPLNAAVQNILIDELGSAKSVFENRKDLKQILPDSTDRLIQSLAHFEEHLEKAEQEMRFVEKGHIQCLCKNNPNYPARLRECSDAPILLYFRGSANLNAPHIVSMVGTRHCTEYGKDFCHRFLADLSGLCPDTLVISGLAYGIDICSHRESLASGLGTVGVLAHGLNQIYPRMHRDTAIQMLDHGGLLTEFMSDSKTEKVNFVSRNRIVAGMSDATIVIESKAKGGSLITAQIANDYSRDVFAVPGRIGDEMSAGCNNLIRDAKATLLQSAEEFVACMGWQTAEQKKKPVQKQLFLDLSTEEQTIVDLLKNTDEGKSLNQLVIEANIPVARLTGLLFELEMKGVVKMFGGGRYRI